MPNKIPKYCKTGNMCRKIRMSGTSHQIGKMKIQMADMCTHAGITCNSIKPEPSYQESLQPTTRLPEYWNNLGSSKNRTKAQEEESRRLIEG